MALGAKHPSIRRFDKPVLSLSKGSAATQDERRSQEMPKAKVGVLISGRGSNMEDLLYAAKHPSCPSEIVLFAAHDPEAPALALAAAEGVSTFGQRHKGIKRAELAGAQHATPAEAAEECERGKRGC